MSLRKIYLTIINRKMMKKSTCSRKLIMRIGRRIPESLMCRGSHVKVENLARIYLKVVVRRVRGASLSRRIRKGT